MLMYISPKSSCVVFCTSSPPTSKIAFLLFSRHLRRRRWRRCRRDGLWLHSILCSRGPGIRPPDGRRLLKKASFDYSVPRADLKILDNKNFYIRLHYEIRGCERSILIHYITCILYIKARAHLFKFLSFYRARKFYGCLIGQMTPARPLINKSHGTYISFL